MAYLPKHLTIRVPITKAQRQQAEAFSKVQSRSAKVEQVYCNTLAVLATQSYLDMQGIRSNLERSYSSNLASHLVMDAADLYIPEAKGRLDCRAVHMDDSTCFIPESDMDDRIGTIVVQLNNRYTEGRILGFIKETSNKEIRFEALGSLDDFIDCLPDSQEPELIEKLAIHSSIV